MRNALFTALLLATGLPATAQTRADEGGSTVRPRFGHLMSEWRAEHGDSWQLVIDEDAHSLELLHGGLVEGPLEPRRDAEWFAQARHFLAQTAALHRTAPGSLVDDRVTMLPLGRFNTTDKMTVRLVQEVGGVPVEGGSINLLFNMDGDLLSIHNKAEAGIEGMDTDPSLSARAAIDQAGRFFRRALGEAPAGVSDPELVIKREHGLRGRRSTLAWRIDLQGVPVDAEPISYRYWIDARTGALLEARDRVHHFDVQGQILTMATPGILPDTASNPPAPVPVPFAHVSSNVGSATTDADGNFNFPGVTTPIDITVSYSGTFNDVVNDTTAGPTYTVTFPQVPAGQANSLLMNSTPDPLVTAQANAFDGADVVRDFIKTTTPTDTTLDFQIRSNTNLAATCNAFYDGASINFFPAGGGCVNTSYSTVVAHELGHWLNDLYSTHNGGDGIGEGNADVFAMYVYDYPIVGEDFAGPGAHIRDGENTVPFCGDSAPACYGQVHADGLPWMGAAWKVRRNLNATHGNTMGDMIANSLFMGWMNAFDQTEIKSIIETQWLTLDDDDGNIANGTPNYPDIDAGFREQGFPGFDLTWVDIQGVTVLANTTDELGPYTVTATLMPTFNPPVTVATLNYRVDGGAEVVVPMSLVGGNIWTATIPGQTAPSEVEYEVSAQDALGGTNDFPPREATIGFRVGVITVAHATEFEPGSNEGWVSGAPSDMATTGMWQRVDPIGTGAQPEDDHTPNTGTRGWFTQQGSAGGSLGEADVDGGATTLFSPVFSTLNMHEPSISYWRWYSNNTGADPNNDIMLIDISNDAGLTWVNAETLGPDGPETNGGWRFHKFRVADFVTPTSSVQMRFIASDLNDGSIVEAGLDDFTADDLGPVSCSAPTQYCATSPNSVGSGATITTTGPQSIASNSFGVFVSGAPAGTLGVVFYGQTQASFPFGDGVRCVSNRVFRMPLVTTDASGFHNEIFDFASPPQPMAQISAGQTWNFQFWYSDPTGPGGTGSNTTDAIAVPFCN